MHIILSGHYEESRSRKQFISWLWKSLRQHDDELLCKTWTRTSTNDCSTSSKYVVLFLPLPVEDDYLPVCRSTGPAFPILGCYKQEVESRNCASSTKEEDFLMSKSTQGLEHWPCKSHQMGTLWGAWCHWRTVRITLARVRSAIGTTGLEPISLDLQRHLQLLAL